MSSGFRSIEVPGALPAGAIQSLQIASVLRLALHRAFLFLDEA